MKRRIAKFAGLGLLTFIAVLAVVLAAFYMMLSQGPVSLNFMTGTLQARINESLSGMSVKIDGALIERAAGSGIPSFRLSNIVVSDSSGNLVARAPRATIGIDEAALFSGRIVPRSLQLIGPRILVRRNMEGGIELGFGTAAAAEEETIVVGEEQVVSEATPAEAPTGSVSGATLIKILAGDETSQAGSMSTIEDIRVVEAAIELFDEANSAVWRVPKAELAFRRMPYGFVVVTNAEVANGREGGSWRADFSASYRREQRSFSISARINDLVPASISDQIFALSQLARVKIPLSGQAEVEMTDAGAITRATFEFLAAAGEVGFPDYLADPIIVDEGSLRADYDPQSGGFNITDSVLLVGGSRAELTGSVRPQRATDGRLLAYGVKLLARNVAIDAQGTTSSPIEIERLVFVGRAAIDEAKLDIDDFEIRSGNTGVRLRGAITGGGESAGLLLSGRVRDLSASLLRRLWPPVVAPKTRAWVSANVTAGRIEDGTFKISLPVDAIARAQRERVLPDNSIDLRMTLAGVNTSYFKDLPVFQKANGELALRDRHFAVVLQDAGIDLPSGARIKLDLGKMEVANILAPQQVASFNFQGGGPVPDVLEYLNLPALGLISKSGLDPQKTGGKAQVSVALKMPLVKGVPKDKIALSARAKIADGSLTGAIPRIDVSNGDLELTLFDGELELAGTAKLNGVPVDLAWHKGKGPGARQSVVIEATFDDEGRRKLGADLGRLVKGPVTVKARIADLADKDGPMEIAADLSKAELNLPAVGWGRPPTSNTKATFAYYRGGEKGRRVENLVVAGPDLAIAGEISLTADGGLRAATLTDVVLDEDNRFSASIKTTEERMSVSVKGASFDTRPLIKSMLTTRQPADTSKPGDGSGVDMVVDASFDRVYANRGEVITGVAGKLRVRGGKVAQAEISGSFLSGHPIVLRIEPSAAGRELRVTGRDGGAILRAANLYSKVAGGELEFVAVIANDQKSSVRQGKLIIRNFEVRNEAALAELDARGKPKKSGPRREGLAFTKLTLPFTTDDRFVKIGESLIKGVDIGATAEGLIRKSDGAIDITGTMIPAYALNAALSDIPLIGDIVTGGKGQGVIGVTFALGGTIDKPVFQANPASALAPGILRRFFDFGGTGTAPTPPKSKDG